MLEAQDIDIFYDDLQALWGVSLTIKRSEIVALVGSNGAGKSTTLRAISGLTKPKRGKINFNGVNIENLPPHEIVERGICMVPEGRRLFPKMSVLENLEVGSYTSKARALKDNNLLWIYEIFPILKARSEQTAGTLSGGEQQMLAIGRALMSDPSVLLVDEMSLGLSPLIVQELSKVLRQLNSTKKVTILLVEQNVRLALNLAFRCYILENGRIVDHGDAKELLESERVKEAYLGMSSEGAGN
jgi:branched-chain amino acid transport system ATP-binding protein